MSSGRLRLSVRGNEDIPISGNPQHSYYLKTFARQEPYENLFVDNSLETIVQGRTPTYGDTISFQVPRRGDLLSKVFLKIVLPPSYLYSNLVRGKTDSFNLYSILEYVELVIGGQLIQRLTGEYILNWINLYYSSNDLEFYKNVTEMKIQDLKKTYASFGQFVLLPIPFYFSQPGQELPLIALTRQHVTINIKLALKPPITGLPDLTDVTVSTEYVLLGSESTKNIFLNNGITYRVTQVQMNYDTISPTDTKKVLDLDFQNPVRELFVCVQPQTYQDINNAKYYNYFGNYRNTFVTYRNTTSGWYLSEQHLTGMSLRFNNNEYINEEGSGSASMMSLTIPQRYYANSDNIQQFKGYVYPFVIDPLSPHPQGHINMSRILKKQMTLFMNTSQFTRTVRVYASSYNTMVIKDGISGLMFTNPSYYNPKLVLGESSEITEGNLPTDTEILSPDQGFYYAIKIDDGHNIVGLQLYTEESPEFASPQDLQDNQFSYLLNTNDTFTSNATLTNTNEYAPGSISQLLGTVIQIPNEENVLKTELYDVPTTNNYIFTSNYGFIRSLRLAIQVHEEGASGPEGTQKVLSSTDFNRLAETVTINLYSSNIFFDSTNIEGWLSNAEVQTKIIRVNNTSESAGYYYVGNSILDAGNNIIGYNKVYFARTYDFSYILDVNADPRDVYDEALNQSTVTYKVSNLVGSGRIQTYLGNTNNVRGTIVYFTIGDTDVTISFIEPNERGLQTYTVVISLDGETDISRIFQVVAGGEAPPLYHAFQYLPPEGSTDQVGIIGLQAYSPSADTSTFQNPLDIVTTNAVPLSNSIMLHTSQFVSNVFFSNIIQITEQYFLSGALRSRTPVDAPNRTLYTMGESDFFYTTKPVSITFYTIAAETSTIPNDNSRLRMYSSVDPFENTANWINNALLKEFTLSQVTSGSRSYYRRIFYQNNPTSTNFSTPGPVYYSTVYYASFDSTPPVMTITFEGTLVQGTITMERFTPLSDYIKLPPSTDQTYLNIVVDDETAIITDINNISNTTVGTYQITFIATDPFFNSSLQTVDIEVVDTQPPALVSNTITGAGLGLTLDVTLNEISNVDLKQNGVVIQSYTDVTGFTKSISGLPEGVLHTYTADTEDQYENVGTLALGSYVPDITPPDMEVRNYSDNRILTGATVFLERYTTFTELFNQAIDIIDGTVDVVIGGSTPDTTERDGEQFIRTYTATDTAGNSNVVTITFEINDTQVPAINVINAPSVNESTRQVTISGEVSEEANVFIYRDSAKTILLADVNTTGVSNSFSSTFVESSDGMHIYYLSAFDGVNTSTSNYKTSEIYLSDHIYRFPYEGFSNTSVTVPSGTSSMYVFLWGGNGGLFDAPNPSNRKYGGSGGFTQSTISPVTPGQTITVNVAEGGVYELGDRIVFGGGGAANNYVGLSVYAGSGGGASNVIYNNITVAVAGGGGGAPGQRGDFGYGGGGLWANDVGLRGGSQTAGGNPIIDPAISYQGEPGQQFLGASTNVLSTGVIMGGGGGGGWYGGASGGSDGSYASVQGGGGGSSWLGRNGASILTHSSNEWGTTTTFEDTSGRTDTAYGLTYTNSKMLRGDNNSLGKPLTGTHYFGGSPASQNNGYAVIMFT